MPSLISGFEYDIFISYRQNDNRSGWVTEFVRSLETELASTIKTPLNVYFDSNPDHGLSETHHVGKSLEGKLKCLIFIPILSQTYCDPESFAWKHELLAFRDLAGSDSLGLVVSVTNGNVASRILPVRIHEIDSDDKQLFEKETGGPLRSVDFIFKSAGVNRPLLSNEDHPQDNLNRTFYRDQINKVALAVKEIVQAVRGGTRSDRTQVSDVEPQRRMVSRKPILVLAGIALLAAIVYATSQLSGSESISDKSIAVLPFENLSGDKEQEYFSNGMMEAILNQLVKIRDLRVISRTSSMLMKDSKLPLKERGRQLGAAHLIEGSVQKYGSKVRITVQLIEAATDNHIWSEEFDRDLTDIFAIQSEISRQVAQKLKATITPEESRQLSLIPTQSKEAYDYYLQGNQLYSSGAYKLGALEELYTRAINTDSNFALAYVARSNMYSQWYLNRSSGWQGKDKLASEDIEKARQLNPKLPEVRVSEAKFLYMVKKDFLGALEILEDLKLEYPNVGLIYSTSGAVARRIGRWKDALRDHEISVTLEPNNPDFIYETARICYAMREYDKGEVYFGRATGHKAERALMRVDRTGDVRTLLADPDYSPSGKAYFRRDFNALFLELDTIEGPAVTENQFGIEPRSLTYANYHYLAGHNTQSKKAATKSILVLDSMLRLSPDDFRIYNSLSQAYAHLGRCDQAIELTRRARELMPLSKDTFIEGIATEHNVVFVLIICKKYDEAMDKLEWLLTLPGMVNFTTGYLRSDPWFDPMRNLPRFKKMIETEYKVVY